MKTYTSQSQDRLELCRQEWTRLKDFLDENRVYFEKAREQYGIEETPPKIVTDSGYELFSPGGWVGRYPGDVVVVPDKITAQEYSSLLDDIGGWFEILSIPTASAVVPLFTDRAEEPRSLLLTYSEALIEYTEAVMAHRPHVDVVREYTLGYELRGQLDIKRTIRQRSNGHQKLVSRSPRFTMETLPNKLLVRFHARLAQELKSLKKEADVLVEYLDQRLSYHEQFLASDFFESLLDDALDTEFENPEMIDKMRHSISGTMVEVVDLWEAYLTDSSFQLDVREQLTVGVKPVSKLYELWVLQKILTVLEDEVGTAAKRVTGGLSKFSFGDRVRLHYDRSLNHLSQILDDVTSSPGRPDYVLVVDDEVVWIGDAKFRYRSSIGLSDYQRLFSYAVDLFSETEGKTLSVIHVGRLNEKSSTHSGLIPVIHQPLRPNTETTQIEELRDEITTAMG